MFTRRTVLAGSQPPTVGVRRSVESTRSSRAGLSAYARRGVACVLRWLCRIERRRGRRSTYESERAWQCERVSRLSRVYARMRSDFSPRHVRCFPRSPRHVPFRRVFVAPRASSFSRRTETYLAHFTGYLVERSDNRKRWHRERRISRLRRDGTGAFGFSAAELSRHADRSAIAPRSRVIFRKNSGRRWTLPARFRCEFRRVGRRSEWNGRVRVRGCQRRNRIMKDPGSAGPPTRSRHRATIRTRSRPETSNDEC